MMEIMIAGKTFFENQAVIACRHCMEGGRVYAVFLDRDGELQLSCELMEHDDDDWRAVSLSFALSVHPELAYIPPLQDGQAAERQSISEDWLVLNIET